MNTLLAWISAWVLIWLIFTAIYFRCELFGKRATPVAIPAVAASDEDCFGSSSDPLLSGDAAEALPSSYDEPEEWPAEAALTPPEPSDLPDDVAGSSDDAEDLPSEDEEMDWMSISEEDFDIAVTEWVAEGEDTGAATHEPVLNFTCYEPEVPLEQVQEAARVANSDNSSYDHSARRDAAKTLRQFKQEDSDLFHQVSQLPMGERMERLMAEYDRVQDEGSEASPPLSDEEKRQVKEFDISSIA